MAKYSGVVFLAGLILLCTSGWFNQQHAVGIVCTIVGGIGVVFYGIVALLLAVAVATAKDIKKR